METVVGTLAAIDPEEDTLVYSIVSSNTDDAFTIDDQGNLIVDNVTALDQGEHVVFTIIVEVSDGELSSQSEVIINVTHVGDVDPEEEVDSEEVLFTSESISETSIYPNQVRDQLQISTSELNIYQSKIQIIDLTSQETIKLDGAEMIDVSTLKSRIYILRLIGGNQILDTRFMKY